MSGLSVQQVENLRKELKNRYGLEIDARITRVEFENVNKCRTYFHAEDSWKEPEQPLEPTSEYEVKAFKDHFDNTPAVHTNTTLAAAMGIYAAYYRAGYFCVELREDGNLLQRFSKR